MRKAVTQEEPMGCGIACAAFALNKSYKEAKELFSNPENSSTIGYYCENLVEALKEGGLSYIFEKISKKNDSILKNPGTIVFIERNEEYPQGHWLIQSEKGWMNSWINFPNISPAEAGFQERLPGKAEWIVYKK